MKLIIENEYRGTIVQSKYYSLKYSNNSTSIPQLLVLQMCENKSELICEIKLGDGLPLKVEPAFKYNI